MPAGASGSGCGKPVRDVWQQERAGFGLLKLGALMCRLFWMHRSGSGSHREYSPVRRYTLIFHGNQISRKVAAHQAFNANGVVFAEQQKSEFVLVIVRGHPASFPPVE